MKEITGENPKGITLIFGSEDKTIVAYNYINRNSVEGFVLFISDKINTEILLKPENVLYLQPKDYKELEMALEKVKRGVKLKAIVIDSISDIYRRERASRKRLAKVLNKLKELNIPTLITAEQYEDFSNGQKRITARDLLFYMSDTVLELYLHRGKKKAIKHYPEKEEVEYTIEYPLMEVKVNDS
jgi:KaiC/GvpD/RAD55 family RecA-like ATPase